MFSNIMLCLGAEFALEPYTGIPWQTGLKRGSALEAEGDSILVREEGFYFVYSQVGLFIVIS